MEGTDYNAPAAMGKCTKQVLADFLLSLRRGFSELIVRGERE